MLERGQLIGMVSDRDVLAAARTRLDVLLPSYEGEPWARVGVAEVMTRDPRTTDPDASAAAAGRELIAHHIGALPVVRGGRLVGILTTSDFVTYICEPVRPLLPVRITA